MTRRLTGALLCAATVSAAPAALAAAADAEETAAPAATARAGDAAETTATSSGASPATATSSGAAAAKSSELPPVVVTARRSGQDPFEAPRTVLRVGGAELAERQAAATPSALEEEAGVVVQATNRGAGAPILRGLIGPQNLILIAGLRFNNSTFRTGPNQYLALIDPSSIGALEVMLGPGSVLYGSDAMGGVINVLPPPWFEAGGLRGRGGVRFASADLSSSVWLETGWQSDRAAVMAGGAWRDFRGLRVGGGSTALLSDFSQGAWHARARVRVGSGELGLTYLGARLDDAGRTDEIFTGRVRSYDNEDDFAYAEWIMKDGGRSELRVAAVIHRTHEIADQIRCGLPKRPDDGAAAGCAGSAERVFAGGSLSSVLPGVNLTRQEQSRDRVLTPGALATGRIPLVEDRLDVLAGAEAYVDQISSDRWDRRSGGSNPWRWRQSARGSFSDGSSYLSLGGWAHLEARVLEHGAGALVLHGGGRLSSVRAEAEAVPGVGDVSYSFTGLVGSVGARWVAGWSWMAYADLSQGYRAPNLQETTVLGDTGSKFEVPNADLEPEKSATIEIGARAKSSAVRAHVSAFASFLSDAIDERELEAEQWAALGVRPEDAGGKPVIQRVNASSGRYLGAQGRLEAGPFLRVIPWAQLAWITGDVEGASGETTPARRIPPLSGAAGLRYEPADPAFVEVYTIFAGAQDRLHPSDERDLRICEDPAARGQTYLAGGGACLGTPGWATVNVRGGYAWRDPGVRLDVALTNIADLAYRVHGSGLDAPGFGLAFALSGEY